MALGLQWTPGGNSWLKKQIRGINVTGGAGLNLIALRMVRRF
jgi:hypothetical protein